MKNRKRVQIGLLLGLLGVGMTLSATACGGKEDSSENAGKVDAMVDWKELKDPRELYPEESTATGETNPQIVKTVYETEDVVIADIVPTEMGYEVDATGATDSTEGIQQALYDCYNAGGGTVYLPAGNYAITDTIYIPPFVTLRGDYQDPDEGQEYGTIISVWMDPGDSKEGGAFMIGSGAGVIGLTVYYPFQTLYEVLPYPCTFYIEEGSMVMTIKNVTVINGYRGIGTSYEIPHDSLIIENFKGTFLDYGTALYNQADVGTIDDVVISSKYWKEATAECMNRPVADVIDKYMKEHTTGMILGDLEWTNFSNVTIEGCATGMKMVAGFRVSFVGSMIDINIEDCTQGMLVENSDERWGTVIARSNIEGGLANAWIGMVRTADTTITGDITEFKPDSVEQNDVDLSGYEINYDASYVKPKENLMVAKLSKGISSDVSSELQKVLDEMGAAGGGVVYIPGGVYRFDNPITVPEGVELRGASSVAGRELLVKTQGTLFMCYYGDDASCNADTDKAFITLAGKNAGLNGVRILYPENGGKTENLNTTYTVRGTNSGVYVVNCFIAASGYGIDFRNCDNHYLRSNYSSCHYNTYYLGGKDGVIRGCLSNPNMEERTIAEGLVNWIAIGETKEALTDPITRENMQMMIVEDAENELIYNVFAYGCKNLLINRNAKDTLAVNIGSDNINAKEAQLINDNSSLVVINDLRYNGHTYDYISGTMKLYNRIAINDTSETVEEIGEEAK